MVNDSDLHGALNLALAVKVVDRLPRLGGRLALLFLLQQCLHLLFHIGLDCFYFVSEALLGCFVLFLELALHRFDSIQNRDRNGINLLHVGHWRADGDLVSIGCFIIQ